MDQHDRAAGGDVSPRRSEDRTTRTVCPNCGRTFNCIKPTERCWCTRPDIKRVFYYTELIIRTGAACCVCPVCLTGKDLEEE